MHSDRARNAARFLPHKSRSKVKLRPALPTFLKPSHAGKPRLLLGFNPVTDAFRSGPQRCAVLAPQIEVESKAETGVADILEAVPRGEAEVIARVQSSHGCIQIGPATLRGSCPTNRGRK